MALQVVKFLTRQPKHEIIRKTRKIPFQRAIERFGFDAVDRGEIRVQNDPLTTDFVDQIVDVSA